jgi:hypothetical protein
MNPYQAPKSEPRLVEPDEPPEAQLAYHHPVWQRMLAVLVPALGGVMLFAAIDSYRQSLPIVALGEFGLSGVMLFMAWRWTR